MKTPNAIFVKNGRVFFDHELMLNYFVVMID